MSGLTQYSANDNCQVLLFIYLYKCQAVMLKTGGGGNIFDKHFIQLL